MAGLFDSLSAANSGLAAARLGLDLAGQNIANINTEGYSRRTMSLAEVPPADVLSAGRGVEVLEIRAVRDRFIELRLGHEQAGSAYDAALLDGLTEVEAAIGQPGSSLDSRIVALFDSFSALSVDVTSPTARDTVVLESQLLATAFNGFDTRLSETARRADVAVRAEIAEVDQLSARVAALNAEMSRNGPEIETLRDQRNQTIAELAAIADVSVIERSGGLVDVVLPGGGALVVGGTAYGITATPTAPNGFVSLQLHDQDVTAVLGGRLGGLIALRDRVIPEYRAALDQLAYDLSAEVNTLHASGFDAAGAPAGNLFEPLATVAGAAASLRVSSTVAADSALVAGSGTGSVGDNQVARAIAALRDGRVLSGGTATPVEAWAQ